MKHSVLNVDGCGLVKLGRLSPLRSIVLVFIIISTHTFGSVLRNGSLLIVNCNADIFTLLSISRLRMGSLLIITFYRPFNKSLEQKNNHFYYYCSNLNLIFLIEHKDNHFC